MSPARTPSMIDFEETFEDELAAVPDEHFDRERFAPPAGSADANVVLVGEAPGATEVTEGEPFVGQAGSRLDAALEAIGVERGDLYITNVVKVRPPENRTPLQGEIEAWLPVLEAEIDFVDPDTIVPMGNTATRALLDTAEGITALRGREFERDGRIVLPTFHPAALLYDDSKLGEFRDDLRAALADAG